MMILDNFQLNILLKVTTKEKTNTVLLSEIMIG